MATKVASLYAEIGANTTGFKKGADEVKGGMGQMAAAMGITATAVGVVVGVIKESYNTYAKLAESVRDLSLVSGTSAEETSRFIQVLDDFQLSAEDATGAARFLAKNGLSPTVETLAKLSDQFRAIQDPADRMVFVQENLGRSGAKWVNVLNQGSAALIANSKAIEGNLILNDQQIKMYEVGRLAIDKYKDKLDGFKTSLGQNAGNVLAYADAMIRANEIMKENTVRVGRGTSSTIEYADALNMAIAEQLKSADASTQQATSMKVAEEAAKEAAQKIKDIQEEISNRNQDTLSLIGTMQDAETNYADTVKSLADDRIKIEQDRADAISKGWWEGSEKIKDYDAALADNTEASIANAEEHDMASKKIILGLLEQQLAQDGLTTTELDYLLRKGEAWGIYSAAVVTDAKAAIREAEGISRAINAIPENKHVNITVTQTGDAASNIDTNLATQLHMSRHAAGGSFIIPSSYGNEGFRLGNSDTASAGERVTITPNGQGASTAPMMDMKLLARTIVTAMQQAG